MLYGKQKIISILAVVSLLLVSAARAEKAPRVSVATPPVAVPTFTFSRNLCLGSSGSDVVGLQLFLEKKGHMVMPSGAARGYFGVITRAALASWQRSVGISPSEGYFGPLSRAKVNAEVLKF